MCPVHNRDLEIICATDKKSICSYCAIFGEHKNYDFKTVEDLEDEIKGFVRLTQNICERKEKVNTFYR